MKFRPFSPLVAVVLALFLTATAPGLRAAPPAATAASGVSSITPEELKEWLSYIASDQLQGRQVYTEGLGLAAAYLADHLEQWRVKPAGDDGTYFQTVKVLGVDTKSNSS